MRNCCQNNGESSCVVSDRNTLFNNSICIPTLNIRPKILLTSKTQVDFLLLNFKLEWVPILMKFFEKIVFFHF